MPGIKRRSPALQADSLSSELSGKPNLKYKKVKWHYVGKGGKKEWREEEVK